MKRVDHIEFSKIIIDKSIALEFLCKRCKTNDAVYCSSCNSEKYYITARGKMRCILEEKGNRGRGAKNKTIVFWILERNGKVSVGIVI
jgi:hypothetical protein